MNDTDLTFRIGANVRCHDKACGELEKVVVDPHTRRVTALVISKGLLRRQSRVVPVSAVRRSHPDIELSIAPDELAELPAYQERVYKEPPKDWETTTQIPATDMVLPMAPWTILQRRALRPVIPYEVHEGVSEESVVIERGTEVACADGPVGHVDHLLASSESGAFTHLVVDRGPLSPRLIVPRDMIGTLTASSITLEASEKDLEELYGVPARGDDDILAELRDRLSDIPFDPDSIEIAIDSGVVRLEGTVADVATKRHVEGVARSINGVVTVRNGLDTATSLRARVVSALASDPRTDLAPIDVVAQGSVVTLSGNVDDDSIVKAAEMIAKEQEGVTEVINELVVQRDADSDLLALRSQTLAALAGAGQSTMSGGGTRTTTPNLL